MGGQREGGLYVYLRCDMSVLLVLVVLLRVAAAGGVSWFVLVCPLCICSESFCGAGDRLLMCMKH